MFFFILFRAQYAEAAARAAVRKQESCFLEAVCHLSLFLFLFLGSVLLGQRLCSCGPKIPELYAEEHGEVIPEQKADYMAIPYHHTINHLLPHASLTTYRLSLHIIESRDHGSIG